MYKANPATLKKTLFNAKLLPPPGMARNIALAAFGRADRKVDQNLALKCWKNDGCNTGTGGKLTVAYVEPFGENVYRHISKMEFILQALTYKSIGKIIYRSAHSDPNQALTDFRAVIAQKRRRHRHLSGLRRRGAAGVQGGDEEGHIPVATYAWGYVERARHELHDGRRRERLQARQGVREGHEQVRQVRRHRLPRRLPGQPAVRWAGRSARSRRSTRTSTSWPTSRRTGMRRRSSRSSPESSRPIPTSRAGATSTGSAWRRARSRRTRPRASRSTPC